MTAGCVVCGAISLLYFAFLVYLVLFLLRKALRAALPFFFLQVLYLTNQNNTRNEMKKVFRCVSEHTVTTL